MSTLQMQAVPVPLGRMRSGAPLPPARQRRWRAFLAVALLVLLGHAILLDGVGALAPAAGRAGGASPLLPVRVVAAVRSAELPAGAEVVFPDPGRAGDPGLTVAPAAAVASLKRPRPPARRARDATPARLNSDLTPDSLQAGARSDASPPRPEEAGAGAGDEPREVAVAAVALPDVGVDRPVDGAATASAPATQAQADPSPSLRPAAGSVAASGVPAAPASTLLLAGEEPPPTYRTRLPPALTLRYEVRSGFLRGNGELRWRPQGDAYSLALDARVSGLVLLRQSSEGALGGEGLAPVRFLDQRARRSAQAANFRREAGKITFSGPATEWPLLAGSQDRLSFFVQLAGIAAGDPALLAEGARIVMVVAGARGDASVWTFRCMGPETIETGVGTVHAIKFVRDARSAYDTTVEIWLDPARHHLPAHATLRNRSGASEVDLLLEGVEAASP